MTFRKVKLDYHPIAERKTDEIVLEVSNHHVNAINRSIDRKVKRNEIENKSNKKENRSLYQ